MASGSLKLMYVSRALRRGPDSPRVGLKSFSSRACFLRVLGSLESWLGLLVAEHKAKNPQVSVLCELIERMSCQSSCDGT